MSRFLIATASCLALFSLFTSGEVHAANPIITSIEPPQGKADDIITIKGSNLKSTLASEPTYVLTTFQNHTVAFARDVNVKSSEELTARVLTPSLLQSEYQVYVQVNNDNGNGLPNIQNSNTETFTFLKPTSMNQ